MEPGNFGAVRQACRALGGDLASIRSDAEMNQVIALLDAEHAIPPVFYLGGAASSPGNWYVPVRGTESAWRCLKCARSGRGAGVIGGSAAIPPT